MSKPQSSKPIGGLTVGGRAKGTAAPSTLAAAKTVVAPTAVGRQAAPVSYVAPPTLAGRAAAAPKRSFLDEPLAPISAVPASTKPVVQPAQVVPTATTAKKVVEAEPTKSAPVPTAVPVNVPTRAPPQSIATKTPVVAAIKAPPTAVTAGTKSVTKVTPIATKSKQPVGSSTSAASVTPRKEFVPPSLPFPDPLPASIVALLNGSKMEAPFTTEASKDFPTRGHYSCIRCKLPIAAAVSKVPIDFGYSGYRQFHASRCTVTVDSIDDAPRLFVRCGGCRGLLGELIQRRVAMNNGFIETEVLKANSACLHFVDEDASKVAGLFDNYSSSDSPTKGGRGPSESSMYDDEDDEDDVDMEALDFDDMDIVGTMDGAANAVKRRRDRRESWRRCAPSGGANPTTTATAATTAADRHKGAVDAMNQHSSSSSDDEDNNDEDADDDDE